MKDEAPLRGPQEARERLEQAGYEEAQVLKHVRDEVENQNDRGFLRDDGEAKPGLASPLERAETPVVSLQDDRMPNTPTMDDDRHGHPPTDPSPIRPPSDGEDLLADAYSKPDPGVEVKD